MNQSHFSRVSTSIPSRPVDLLLKRVFSIDVFRALTMLIMIFVNDFGTLSGIPVWLEHAHADQDFLGFSDVVFPCFLIIVGMSIPFSIRQRLDKGDSYLQIIWHITLRSIALLVMGVFTVNTPDLNEKATGMRVEWYQILMVLGFFSDLESIPQTRRRSKNHFYRSSIARRGITDLPGHDFQR